MKWEKQQIKTLEFNGVEYIKIADIISLLTNITECTPDELQTIYHITGAFAKIQSDAPLTSTHIKL